MEPERSFSILNSVDSTNNYAMGKVHAGLAKHGQAWFANHQTQGKGQRGRVWLSTPGENIILTVVLRPDAMLTINNFAFNAYVALTCLSFLRKIGGDHFSIKWPNDLYWCDRKAGGILIENVIQGMEWRWSVVGIGINVIQREFPDSLKKAVSLWQITGLPYDAAELARQLHQHLVENLSDLRYPDKVMEGYNENLYKKDQEVKLRKENVAFVTTIKGVDAFGNLHTEDTMERSFTFGEVQWVGDVRSE